MSLTSLHPVLVALPALSTFIVIRQVCRDHIKLGPPEGVAAAAAGLAALGLLRAPEASKVTFVLIYAALGLTFLILFVAAVVGALIGPPKSGRRMTGGSPALTRNNPKVGRSAGATPKPGGHRP